MKTSGERWTDINITVGKCMHELSSTNYISIRAVAVKYNQILVQISSVYFQ
ncbi:MAG: hypothetical protein M1515_01385 [Candidatus Thermoplasmatota archaeon]|nr:hypothetical protein [Candidatus Thermoplasmatota archaeon]